MKSPRDILEQIWEGGFQSNIKHWKDRPNQGLDQDLTKKARSGSTRLEPQCL